MELLLIARHDCRLLFWFDLHRFKEMHGQQGYANCVLEIISNKGRSSPPHSKYPRKFFSLKKTKQLPSPRREILTRTFHMVARDADHYTNKESHLLLHTCLTSI